MPDLFKDIVPSILETKQNVLIEEHDEKDYNPYIVNRALSYHLDCVPYVNQINQVHFVDKKLQYHYLLNSIRQMKRKFKAWQKSEEDKNLACVKEYFGYSNSKAKEALRILSDEQIAYIKTKTDKGGVRK
jgi:hypothetical protein